MNTISRISAFHQASKARFSPNCDARPAGIDAVILHYTGMESAEAAAERLTDPSSRVSAHYLIDESGDVLRLVPEEARAWHAGISEWRGQRNLNDSSIGIELVNRGHDWGYHPFPEPQMAALERLLFGILARHVIDPRRVLGHSDIAPNRKADPGEKFDWRRLALQGLAWWPDAAEVRECGAALPESAWRGFIGLLTEAGYPTGPEMEPHLLTAFRRRFRPHALGRPLAEQDLRIAEAISLRA